jgi:hypothetical protein
MSKLFGIHTIALRPGVKAEDFEKFVKEELPLAAGYPSWKYHVLKGERGDREGKYLVLIEIESVEERNRFSPSLGEQSEEAKQFEKAHSEDAKIYEKWDTLAGGFSVIYTDYVELD